MKHFFTLFHSVVLKNAMFVSKKPIMFYFYVLLSINLPYFFIWPEGHWEPRNEVGFLNPAEHLVGLGSGAFRFGLSALTH